VAVVDAFTTGFVPADVTLELGDSIRWINKDAVASIDNAVPEPPFCWLDTVGTLNNVGSDFSVGAGAGIKLIGTWSYRDAANPTRTGKFSVAVSPATIATIALDIGPACALPATTAVFLGDKINVRNTAEVAYTFRISNSVGTLIRQCNIVNGQTVVVDTLTTVGLAGGQAYTVRCEGTTATPGALTIGLSRNNNNSPATPAPPGQTLVPPEQTPQLAGAPSQYTCGAWSATNATGTAPDVYSAVGSVSVFDNNTGAYFTLTDAALRINGINTVNAVVAHVHEKACNDGVAGFHFKKDITIAGNPLSNRERLFWRQQRAAHGGINRSGQVDGLERMAYSRASDVSAFGVLLYEIFARSTPWPGLANVNVITQVVMGKRMELPKTVPAAVRKVMKQCWAQEATQRPKMSAVVDGLHAALTKAEVKGNDATD
jgi:hypothetical protein